MSKQPDPTQKPASPAGTAQGVLVFCLLLVGAFSGGYYLGTQANFSRMEGFQSGSAPGDLASWFGITPRLKKQYWLHTKGYDRAGYTITVAINGQTVDKFYKPDVDVDVTRFIHPGTNVISFSARSLPLDQRQDNQSAYLTIELRSAEKQDKENGLAGGDVLLDYTRALIETQDFNDKKEFEPIE